jgi:hypothetical protein
LLLVLLMKSPCRVVLAGGLCVLAAAASGRSPSDLRLRRRPVLCG